MNFALCDDDRHFLQNLDETLSHCKAMPADATLQQFTNGADLIASYHKPREYDIVFLDVEMPVINGIEVGRKIRAIDKDVILVYLTNYQNYYRQSFRVEAFDYLSKPVNIADLNAVLARAIKKHQVRCNIVSLQWQSQRFALDVRDIVYVESYQRHLRFYTPTDRYECVGKIKQYETSLTPYGFLRCHQGFLINMKYIRSIGANVIQTSTDSEIYMSRGKKRECMKRYNEFIARFRI